MTDIVERLRRYALPDPHDDREVLHAPILSDAADELTRLQRLLDLKAAAMRQLEADVARLRACEQLARDLLDPERLGFADPMEIRDAARRALGIAPVEVKVAMASFNEANARRDALSWPRGSLGEEVADNAEVKGAAK